MGSMFLFNKFMNNFSTGLFNNLSTPLHQVKEGATLPERCSLSLAPNAAEEQPEEMKSKCYLKVYQMTPLCVCIHINPQNL